MSLALTRIFMLGTEAKTELVQSDGNNTYYITETGQCYFQADSIPNGQVVTVVSGMYSFLSI